MNAYAVTLPRVLVVPILVVASLVTACLEPASAAGPVHIPSLDPGVPSDRTLATRELPAVPPDLANALASPEVTSALGGPADAARARAAELGERHLLAAWAPSVSDPRAGVAVATNARGELYLATVRESRPGVVLLGSGGAVFELRIGPGGDGFELQRMSDAMRSGATSLDWACFSSCFVQHVPACTMPCLECANSGFTQCTSCLSCIGLWAVFCASGC
jgi:hypothetical protein